MRDLTTAIYYLDQTVTEITTILVGSEEEKVGVGTNFKRYAVLFSYLI